MKYSRWISCAPASIFARAGVEIAKSIGADILAFGSECGDTEKLIAIQEKIDGKEFEGGSAYDAPLGKSEFGYGLRRRLFLRPACHTCPYMTCDRVGDLSLGSYHGLPKDFAPEEQAKGVSLLLVNSVKGAHMFDTLPLKKEKRPLSEAAAANAALSGPTDAAEDRAAFFDAFARQSFQQVREKFLISSPLPVETVRKKLSLFRIFRKKEH